MNNSSHSPKIGYPHAPYVDKSVIHGMKSRTAVFHALKKKVLHPVPSRETIRRRLIVLRSRRPLRRLPLTPHHRQCQLDFCRPRATWSVTDWRRVIFSDEFQSQC
ncbi:HTH_Tnp_Tc3_2 domain-containing protein [Trichonephila clavipes]|nr:HTH_Tnp_Tc3_2 domain-containing protein [Trichonephila clavipes]